ncbi:MAG: ketoacyl-ACP synthase III [Bacteroidetes bacterium]|nr:MAG: ketoacyl-ACP synthase III [Bacteroidota bacterium]
MRNAVIISTGAYVPEHALPNSYFNDLLGEDVDTWLRENLQMYERRWCAEGESTADLCEAAAKVALQRAGVDPKQLNLIIVATDTPEYLSPSTASVVQFRLGAGHAGTFDLNSACAGFTTALDVGSKYIRTDENYQYVLIIGAYAMSKYLDKTDKKTVTLFADGAGAVLLSSIEDNARGYLASELITLGQYYDGMGIYAGGTKHPISHESLERKEHLLKLFYRFPPELNPQMWTHLANKLCERTGISPSEVKQYFLTQVNINSIRKTLDNLKVPRDRAHTTMHYYGYTGSASIPITLDDAIQKGKVQQNDLIFFIGSGGGLSFGSLLMRY